MKMRAGGKLNSRKASRAPNRAKASTAPRVEPCSSAIAPMAAAAKAPMPPARPSMPSIRFTALAMPTSQITVSG